MTQPARKVSVEHFAPVQATTVVQEVMDQIIDGIQSGHLPQGALLPGERQLSAAMHVSRRTLREALNTLQDVGLVTVAPGPAGGTRIASIWAPSASWGDAGDTATVTQIFLALEARRLIEPRVAQLAALRGRDEDFCIMRETIDLQRANSQDQWRRIQGNAIFHRRLWRAAHNPQLESAMRSIYRCLSGAFLHALEQDVTSESPEIALDLHEATLSAVMRGSPDEIDQVMQGHLAYLERRCEIALGRARLPRTPDFLSDVESGDEAALFSAAQRSSADHPIT